MKVAELAELTGTTVRTIRHYHQVGLLPVPAARGGWRDYDVSHVARLARIRWLSEAGMSLAAVRDVVGDGAGDPREDLRATLAAIDVQLDTLQMSRARIQRLLTAVDSAEATSDPEGHALLSPMPATVARFYALLEERAPDDATRRAIRRERDFAETAYYRGEVPPEAERLYELRDEAAVAACLESFREIGRRGADPSPRTDQQIAEAAQQIVDRMIAVFGADASTVAQDVDLEGVTRMYDTFARLMGPEDARLGAAVHDCLTTYLRQARS